MRPGRLAVMLSATSTLLLVASVRGQKPTAEAHAAPATPSAEDAAVRAKLDTLKIGGLTLTEETGRYPELVRLLRTVTGLPILITPAAKKVAVDQDLSLAIDLVGKISVASFLDLMVARSEQLGWDVRHGVVEITTHEQAQGAPVMRLWDVRALTMPHTEFLPPVIGGLPTGEEFGGSGATSRTGGEGEEKTREIEPDALIQMIEMATGPEKWTGEGAGTIEWVESGYLLVHAPRGMQHRVGRLLRALR